MIPQGGTRPEGLGTRRKHGGPGAAPARGAENGPAEPALSLPKETAGLAQHELPG